MFRGWSEVFELADLLVAMFKAHAHELAVMGNLCDQPFAEGIDDRSTDAMQTARGLVAAFAGELAAGMEHGENDLQGIHAALVHADRHTAAFVFDRAGTIRIQRDGDFLSVAIEGFINGIIYDFPDQMMQAMRIRRADIHARTLADRIQTVQDLNIIIFIFSCLCHRTPSQSRLL